MYKQKVVIGDCTLYHGDCMVVMPLLGKVDCIISDPPYIIDVSGAGAFGKKNRPFRQQIIDKKLDQGFNYNIITQSSCDSCVIFCHNDQLVTLIPFLASVFDKYCICFWHKQNPMPVANKYYQPECEIFIHAWNKDFYPIGKSLSDMKRVFSHPVGKSDYNHPTVKPIELMTKIVKNTQGNIISDPFMGSGSTGVACVKEGRSFIGIELDEEYFNIACKRIEDAYRQADMFVAPSAPVSMTQEPLI